MKCSCARILESSYTIFYRILHYCSTGVVCQRVQYMCTFVVAQKYNIAESTASPNYGICSDKEDVYPKCTRTFVTKRNYSTFVTQVKEKLL